MNKLLIVLLSIIGIHYAAFAQPSSDCKLHFGTNMSRLVDWGTDLPFVDMMKNCREWYSKDNTGEFESGQIANMTFRADGYPTQIPQTVAGLPQRVATIWAKTDGWEPGRYVVLFDGSGTLHFDGADSVSVVTPNRYTFALHIPEGKQIQMIIETSSAADPVRNIRIVKASYETTYLTHPFNPHWIEKLRMFNAVRFMDWGHTNHWGQQNEFDFSIPGLVDWSGRARYDYYTWATSKGIPYEMMVRLMNDYDLDGWVCVPHRTSANYKTNMARYFRDNVEPSRHLYVEYSNEIWNWIFGQAKWVDSVYCVAAGAGWPEGFMIPIQNNLDIWTAEYAGQLGRITRVVGSFTGYRDATKRYTYPLNRSSYDAIAPTFYFGLNEAGDSILDRAGASATTAMLAAQVRANMPNELAAIRGIKQIADSVGKKMIFYEGGNHITSIPFGDSATYCHAIVNISRDTTIYNLYTAWYDSIATLQSGTEPLQCMNFSFISKPDCQYGSWGIWETLYQDTVALPPYKVRAIRAQQNCTVGIEDYPSEESITLYPNPFSDQFTISTEKESTLYVFDIQGKLVYKTNIASGENYIALPTLQSGIYFVKTGNSIQKLIKQ